MQITQYENILMDDFNCHLIMKIIWFLLDFVVNYRHRESAGWMSDIFDLCRLSLKH